MNLVQKKSRTNIFFSGFRKKPFVEFHSWNILLLSFSTKVKTFFNHRHLTFKNVSLIKQIKNVLHTSVRSKADLWLAVPPMFTSEVKRTFQVRLSLGARLRWLWARSRATYVRTLFQFFSWKSPTDIQMKRKSRPLKKSGNIFVLEFRLFANVMTELDATQSKQSNWRNFG